MTQVKVIGAGLAGSECAWQLAQHGIRVTLREMKPLKRTPAHVTDDFAELCCSKSLRGAGLEPKRLKLLCHSPTHPPYGMVVEAVKQGRPGLSILPVTEE